MGKHQPTNILASYLVLKRGDKVLLARRANTGYHDGEYSLPAGHVEAGESFTQALVREVGEEIGIRVALADVRVAHILHRKAEDGSERAEAFYVAEHWDGEITNLEPEKCDDLSWFRISELPVNTIQYIRVILENIEKGSFYSEYGW